MAADSTADTPAVRTGEVTEFEAEGGGDLPLYVHPGWAEAHPWLIQGVTARNPSEPGRSDLRLFGPGAGEPGAGAGPFERWRRLGRALDVSRIVHGRQVHGRRVLLHGESRPGLFLAWACDGHVTASPGILLTITVADCVPVFLVDPGRRAVGLLHAGWRGAAAGILERGVEVFRDRLGISPGGLRCHLGPAICGDCYEVGPEVHRALGLSEPSGPEPVDLRKALADHAVAAGIRPGGVTRSSRCTLCGDSPFFSHRGGDGGRQVALAAIRRPGPER